MVQLTNTPWLPLPELFAVTPDDHESAPSIFSAQSWITMHYLLNQNKLSETGTYMGLVEARNVAVPEAVQQAYGVSAAQFETIPQRLLSLGRAISTGRANTAGSSIRRGSWPHS